MNLYSEIYRIRIRLLIALSLTMGLGIVHAQSGFTKSHHLHLNDYFRKVLYKDGDLYLSGMGAIESVNRQSVYMVKADTFGHIKQIKILPDSLGYWTYADWEYSMIITSDGGFLLSYFVNQLGSTRITKLDSALNIEWSYDVPKLAKILFGKQLIEVDSGFLIGGTFQTDNFDTDLLLMLVSQQGELVWEKYMGGANQNEFLVNFFKSSDGRLFFTTYISNYPFPGPADSEFSSNIWELDENENLILKMETEINPIYGPLLQMIESTKGYLFLSAPVEYDTSFMINRQRGGLIQFDTSFNVLWQKQYGEYSAQFNVVMELKQDSDNNITFCGSMSRYGWMIKTDENGNLLWDLRTVLYDTIGQAHLPFDRTQLSGTAQLPSGSMIAVGSSTIVSDTVAYHGFMLKVTSDGCIDTLCLTTSDETIYSGFVPNQISLYPNPGEGTIHIRGITPDELLIHRYDYQVFNSTGLLVQRDELTRQHIEIRDEGLYFLSIFKKGMLVHSGKVIVR